MKRGRRNKDPIKEMKEEEKKEINDSIHAMAKMQNIEITIFDQLKARSVSVEPPTIQSP